MNRLIRLIRNMAGIFGLRFWLRKSCDSNKIWDVATAAVITAAAAAAISARVGAHQDNGRLHLDEKTR